MLQYRVGLGMHFAPEGRVVTISICAAALSEKQWQEQGNGAFLEYLFRWLAAHMNVELDVKTEEQTAPKFVFLEAFAESLWRNFAETVHKLVVRPDYLFLPKPAEVHAQKTSTWAYAAVELKRPEQLCLRQYVQKGSVEAFIDFFCDKQFSIDDIQARCGFQCNCVSVLRWRKQYFASQAGF